MFALWVGLELTMYGMGLVFLLLAALWGLIALLIRFDRQPPGAVHGEAAAEPPVRAAGPGVVARALDGGEVDDELLAAVVIACRAHRMARRKQAAPEMRTHWPGSLPSRWVGAGRTRQNRSWVSRGRQA